MKEALFYEKLSENRVKCRLCGHGCVIPEGKRGICRVRINQGGVLYTLVYGRLVAEALDPIEKKPLYHFLPGSLSYSISTVGCNFRCLFCQNYHISQYPVEEKGIPGEFVSPEEVVERALFYGAKSISYTYTEPTIYFEYALDVSKIAKEKGLKNVFVSNGYLSIEAIEAISPYLDGINVDLKSFRDDFYKRLCGARLKPVLDSLKALKRAGVWVEVTTLLIPGENDDPEEVKDIAQFIKEELGAETPWHISRFYPNYRLMDHPPTSLEALEKAYEIGKEAGLKFVYLGNVPGHQTEHTYCPSCGKLLIKRDLFRIEKLEITDEGRCPACGSEIEGVWK